MTNYKTVIVAIDIHSDYEAIVERALSVAESSEDVLLTYVSLPSTYIQPYIYGMTVETLDDGERIDQAKEQLLVIAKKYGIDEDNVHVLLGSIADEIQQLAFEKDADLIVIGTHGRSGLKLLLGSTANAVLHGVKQDVLAVRMKEE